MTGSELIYTITTWAIPLILAIVVHEVAHGYVALLCGDRTARDEKRLTLNPWAHVDIVGTIILPVILLLSKAPFLVGWAKPVPVNYGNLNRPNRDMALVALAGPISNILLAVVFVLIGKMCFNVMEYGSPALTWVMENVHNGVVFSLILAAFNMIPILPLDGGRILLALLPPEYAIKYQRFEPYGMMILFGLIFLPSLIGINIIGWFLGTAFPWLYRLVMLITG